MTPAPESTKRNGTRTEAVMAAIRARVASRSLASGDRLPSIRDLAGTMSVSPSTVVEAYDRLVAEGLIRAKPGSGFYVSAIALPPFTLAENLPPRDRAIDPLWVSRESLDAMPAALKPGCGWMPPDWMPTEALRRAFRAVSRLPDAQLTDYGATRGAPALRKLLMARYAEEGLDCSPDQLMLTASGTHAVDLVCRYLLRPGDTVLVDDPCYFNFRALLRAHQAKVASVPYTATGPDLARFEQVVVARRPRIYLTNSALHNPSGATLSAQVAHRLLNVADAQDVIIVEDDIFADFEPEPSVRLAAVDGLRRVIRIGSFSKTLSAAVRCGYIAARPDWIADLVDLQVATSFAGASPIAAGVVAAVLAGGSYRKHMEEVRRRLARARRQVADRLQRIGIEPWLMPRGGFYLWCRLPERCDSAALARAALDEDIVLAPGNVFSATQSAKAFMRFNVAHCGDARLMPALQRQMHRLARSQPGV